MPEETSACAAGSSSIRLFPRPAEDGSGEPFTGEVDGVDVPLQSKARWPQIRDANFQGAKGMPPIEAGQVLVIP